MTPCTESLWHCYRKTGSISLRNRLAIANDKLALAIAHRWARQCPEPVEDLAQIGRIGLIKAIQKFDPTKGVAFSSFAVPYISGEIQHFLRDHWDSVKVPRRVGEKASAVKRDARRMLDMGRVVQLDQVAVAHGIDRDRWAWMAQATARKTIVSLEETLHLSAADDSDDSDRQLLKQELLEKLAALPRLQYQCLTERYFAQLSDETIAKTHNLSVVQVQALILQAITQLREQLQEAAV